MQRIKLLLIAICVGFFVFSSLSNMSVSAFVTGSDPGNTGAPGEGTCAGCHFGGPLGGQLRIDGVPDFYSPSQEVDVTVNLTQAGRVRFGFQLTAIDDQGNAAGEIIVTDAARTQLRSGNFGGHDRTYIEQNQTGSSGTGGTSWTFRWRAPSTNVGRVTFYVAGLTANNDSTSIGDSTYLSQRSLNPAPSSRALRIVDTSIAVGSSGQVSIEIDALGDENTIGLSIDFNEAILLFTSVQLASGVPAGTTLLAHTSQTATGRLGLAISLPFGTAISAGTRQLVAVTFSVPGSAMIGTTQIAFTDSPIAREITRANGTDIPLNQVTFTPGSVNITGSIPPRNVRAIGSTIELGGSGSVVFEIDALGNENGLAFSVNFDQTKLSFLSANLGPDASGASLNVNNTQLANGRVGVGFALPANQVLTAGTRQVLSVTLSATQGATPGPTQIGFGDIPVLRELVDTTAATLPANYVAGTVILEPSYEGDTSPRPFGNGTLSLADWVQGGRFAVGLDVPASTSEFQRADCAPRNTLGNGVLSLADWVQAGRYGAGLDPITTTGGPLSPSGITSDSDSFASKARSRERTAKPASSAILVTSPLSRRGIAHVVMSIEARGVENAINFTISFDPNLWEFVGAQAGWDAMNGTLIVGRSAASRNRVELTLALPPGLAVSPGWRQLVELKFKLIGKPLMRLPVVRLADDTLSARSIVDVFANDLNFQWQVKERSIFPGENRPAARLLK